MARTCAVLDDYQNVALEFADWSGLAGEVEVTVFNAPLGGHDEVVRALGELDIVCLMRERTAFPREVIENLPRLKLIVTTGLRNAAIDVAAAADHGVTVCGTQLTPIPPPSSSLPTCWSSPARSGSRTRNSRMGRPGR